MPNVHYLVRKLLGRATCVKHPTARLGPRARVINIRGDSGCIAIGEGTVIDGDLLVFAHGGRIDIGDWCFVGEGTRIWSGAQVRIGNRVLISHNVNILDNLTHPLDAQKRHQHFRQIALTGHPRYIDLDDRPVTVEDDAWIGAACTILRGLTIGTGAIVAAAAVVTQDVPAWTVVAGNPARPVKSLLPSVTPAEPGSSESDPNPTPQP